jgi:Zn-dependent protease with chaperone function
MRGDKFRPGPDPGKAMAVAYSRRLLSVLRRFYLRGFFGLFLLLEILIDLLLKPSRTLALSSLAGLFLLALLDADLLARFQYRDAIRNGAAFLVKRLRARAPILTRAAEAAFEDEVERLRCGAGSPWVKPYVIPQGGLDAVVFIEADGTPALAATEDLLTESPAPEREAVLAQSLERLANPSAATRTLLCGLADFYARFADVQLPGYPRMAARAGRLGARLGKTLRRFLNPEDELRADERAARRLGDARPLAEILDRARAEEGPESSALRNYGPLRFAPERSLPQAEGRAAGWRSARPTSRERIKALKSLSGASPSA